MINIINRFTAEIAESDFYLRGGQTLRPSGGADWLTAVECFYGVVLVGGSTLAYFVPLIKEHDIGAKGMSPQFTCSDGSRKSQEACGSCEHTCGAFTPLLVYC